MNFYCVGMYMRIAQLLISYAIFSTNILALSIKHRYYRKCVQPRTGTQHLALSTSGKAPAQPLISHAAGDQFDTGEVAQSCMAGHNHLTKSVMGVIVGERIDSL